MEIVENADIAKSRKERVFLAATISSSRSFPPHLRYPRICKTGHHHNGEAVTDAYVCVGEGLYEQKNMLDINSSLIYVHPQLRDLSTCF